MTKAKTTYETFKSRYENIEIEFSKHALDRILQIKKDRSYVRSRIESGNVYDTTNNRIGVVNGHYVIIGTIVKTKMLSGYKKVFLVITIVNKHLRKLYEQTKS